MYNPSNPNCSFPDHPDIARAMREGYPYEDYYPEDDEPNCCEFCGDEFGVDEKRYYNAEYEYLCKYCLCKLQER